MNYSKLARIYDELVRDDEATLAWANFVKDRLNKDASILELACGSGELALHLTKDGYTIKASDISNEMLLELKKKDIYNQVECLELDMTNFNLNEKFDGILCFCDSINYLSSYTDLEKMIQCVSNHLNDEGVFMFDMHTQDRLLEFKEMFIEEGQCDHCQYQWTICSQEDIIHHHFSFWFDDGGFYQEMHQQRVFNCDKVVSMLQENGFNAEVYTDFNQEGIHEGEKIFIVGRKKG